MVMQDSALRLIILLPPMSTPETDRGGDRAEIETAHVYSPPEKSFSKMGSVVRRAVCRMYEISARVPNDSGSSVGWKQNAPPRPCRYGCCRPVPRIETEGVDGAHPTGRSAD